MKVAVVGAGLMGAQIGCEYALGGHDVTLLARDAEAALARSHRALSLVRELELASADDVDAARRRLRATSELPDLSGSDVAVESLPEDLELKVGVLSEVAAGSPEAILATNTSSLSVSELGERVGASERTLGTHYWNPPLLMPLVEVVRGRATAEDVVDRVTGLLRALGKRPIVAGDVPGFVWNRLQHAVLREAVWLVEHGVATPATIDEALTHGLARRWRNVGFFEAIALGGADTWERVAGNLFPKLSNATALAGLDRWLEHDERALAEVAARRDRGLARDLRAEAATVGASADGGRQR